MNLTRIMQKRFFQLKIRFVFYFMDYLVLDCGYNYGKEDADIMFATNEKEEAIEAAKDFGAGTVVVKVDEKGEKTRIFTAPYKSDLAVNE